MATSGSSDYNRNRTQIVSRALRIIGATEAGETPSSEDSESAIEALNAMVKAWQADGLHLWKYEEATLFLTAGTAKYSLGSTGDHAAIGAIKTELAADVASGAGSITVDSITGISNADNIGIVLDDGTIQWTTVNGAPSGATVTLTANTTGAASEDNHVYIYTTKLARPLRVDSARRRGDNDQDTPMTMWSRQEYFDTPNKTSQGVPTAAYYDPQLTNGEIHIWQAPNTVNDRILMTVQMPIEDFDSATDNPDFPQEWLEPLAFGLADVLLDEYSVPAAKYDRIAVRAAAMKNRLLGWDSEDASIYFTPDYTERR